MLFVVSNVEKRQFSYALSGKFCEFSYIFVHFLITYTYILIKEYVDVCIVTKQKENLYFQKSKYLNI